MIAPAPDYLAAEIRAAEDRRRGLPIIREYADPHRAETRRRIDEIADAKRLREATEWL